MIKTSSNFLQNTQKITNIFERNIKNEKKRGHFELIFGTRQPRKNARLLTRI